MHLASLLIAFILVSMIPGTVSIHILKFLQCIGGDTVTCSALNLFIRYSQMQYYQCPNCDKYFHCQGNFDAVYFCGTNITENARIAKKSELSSCFEVKLYFYV